LKVSMPSQPDSINAEVMCGQFQINPARIAPFHRGACGC
jgi:hypothetical protein